MSTIATRFIEHHTTQCFAKGKHQANSEDSQVLKAVEGRDHEYKQIEKMFKEAVWGDQIELKTDDFVRIMTSDACIKYFSAKHLRKELYIPLLQRRKQLEQYQNLGGENEGHQEPAAAPLAEIREEISDDQTEKTDATQSKPVVSPRQPEIIGEQPAAVSVSAVPTAAK